MKLVDKIFIYTIYALTVIAWGSVYFTGFGIGLPIAISLLCAFTFWYHKSL
jgi:hypothetical protein